MDRHPRTRRTDGVRRAPGRRLPADHPLRHRWWLHQPCHRPGGHYMKWVTRARPKTDRIACPWLIRKFIDPDAEILYVPSDQVLDVAERDGAHGFDTPGTEFDHVGNKCTFEVLIAHYELGDDPALVRLAQIVDAADIDSEVHTHPFAPALLALAFGGLDVESDDDHLLDRAS